MIRSQLVAETFAMQYLENEPFPLDLERVALAIERKLDLPVILYKTSLPAEITAQLVVGRWLALIHINQNLSIQRQRFGVAHEFGHLLLDHEYGVLTPGCGESRWENDAANCFAAALLMPSWSIETLASRYRDSLHMLLIRVAKYHGVSIEAAARRLVDCENTGLFTIVNPETRRLDWEYHSSDIYLNREAFTQYLKDNGKFLRINRNHLELDREIMGYPFRIEVKPISNKYLVTCFPFMRTAQAL